jgi:hypothetical protein
MGARHNYAIRRMLEKVGHLQALNTCSNGVKGIGALLRRLPKALTRGQTANLTAQLPDGIPLNKIYHMDTVLYRCLWASLGGRPSTFSVRDDDLLFDERVTTWDFANSNTLPRHSHPSLTKNNPAPPPFPSML